MKMLYDSYAASDAAGKLLSEPSGEENVKSQTRPCSNYEDNSDRFRLKDRTFQRQYAHIYAERLATLRPRITKTAQNKWGKHVALVKLFELQSDTKCVVIGTTYKHMELKPNILREISEETNTIVPPPREKYTDEEDLLILEDELQRITLVGKIDTQAMVTGVNIAVFGMEPDDDRGRFHVEDFCFLDLPEQPARPILEHDRFMVLVSGLEFGKKDEDLLSMQLLADYVTGQLGDEGEQAMVSNIARMIVIGNSLSQNTQDKDQHSKAKYLTKKASAGSIEGVKSLDDFLIQLAACIDVDVMPGEFDPANFTMPQQPLHRCMFPQATMYPTMHCVTNPYDCSVEGVRLLGSSGQPVSDIYKFCNEEDRLHILEQTLSWGHMAPTAPDTLGCYPFYKEDPFILPTCPHVYFAGNQPTYKVKTFKGAAKEEVLLISVPRFSSTKTAVLINLRTLSSQPLTFGTTFTSQTKESPGVDK